MSLPIVIIGNGGHASVVCNAIQASGRTVIAATDVVPGRQGRIPLSIPIITDEQLLDEYSPESIELAIGVGSLWPNASTGAWQRISSTFQSKGFRFATVIHPFTSIAPSVIIERGCQIHAGTVIQPGVAIGSFSILNSRVSVDHDSKIGAFCHLAPGTTLSGDVHLSDGCHLGTGCSVVQGVQLGKECFVAAGATVVTSFPDHQFVKGTPAKPFSPSIHQT